MTAVATAEEPAWAGVGLDDAVYPASGLAIHDDAANDGRRVLELPGARLARVGADMGRLVDTLLEGADAALTPRRLAASLGAPWTPEVVAGALASLATMGVICPDPARDDRARVARRVRFRPPLVLQYTLLDPHRLFDWARRHAPLFTGRAVPSLALGIGVAGVPVVASLIAEAGGPLTTSIAPGVLLPVLGALFATMALHELAHGATLAAYGGRSRRMGVMLFYFAPALFCDVTEAWRMPRAARVRIACAGIVVQGFLAGLSAVVACFVDGSAQQALAVYSVLNYLLVVVNLVPFVKLDGYVALAGWLDHPHLRRDAIGALKARLVRGVLTRARDRSEPGWMSWFGLMALVTPVYLVMSALATVGQLLVANFGVVGAVVNLAALVALGAWAMKGALALGRAALELSVPLRRLCAAGALAAVIVAGAATLVAVPLRIDGGLTRAADGSAVVAFTLAQPAGRAADRTGSVAGAGFLFRAQPGASVRVGSRVFPCRVSVDHLTPVRSSARIPANCLPAAPSGPIALPYHHRVRLDAGRVPLATWLWERYCAPSLRLLGVG